MLLSGAGPDERIIWIMTGAALSDAVRDSIGEAVDAQLSERLRELITVEFKVGKVRRT